MSNSLGNPALEMLRNLSKELRDLRIEMHDQFGDINQRALSAQRHAGSVKNDIAMVRECHARQCASIDKLTTRVERIEQRLNQNHDEVHD